MKKNVYPVRTINHLHPLLVGFRKSKGMTQKEMAQRLGVTQQTYARLEAHPASASFARLFKVMTLLGVEIVLSPGETALDLFPAGVNHNDKCSPARREQW